MNIHSPPSYSSFKAFQISSCWSYRRIEWHFSICHQFLSYRSHKPTTCCYCCCTQTLLLVDSSWKWSTLKSGRNHTKFENNFVSFIDFRFSFLKKIFPCILIFCVFFWFLDWLIPCPLCFIPQPTTDRLYPLHSFKYF